MGPIASSLTNDTPADKVVVEFEALALESERVGNISNGTRAAEDSVACV
jgi:hypothetical protein